MAEFLEKLAKVQILADTYKALPESPGVYVFFKGETPIYVGKAINLKRRVGSYFDLDLSPKTAKMVRAANFLSYVQVTSELEALLLEAKLIRKYMPQYNIALKDDKHPLYIVVTKEIYPRIITARKADISETKSKAVYGPFPSSANVGAVLRHIRRIFPFSDHKLGKRACLYSHIGLCDPCPSIIHTPGERKVYLKNIRSIKAILDGHIGKVKLDLQKRMDRFSKEENYESAIAIREKIKKIEYITQPQIPSENYLENPNLYEDVRQKEIQALGRIIKNFKLKTKNLNRIECFDIAHLAGTNPTASMVTFVDGEADKNYYRHFKIRQKKGASDVDSMREVIKRRKNHFNDWGKPDLIIVDGGKPQVGVFIRELEGSNIPIVGLAKRFETLVIPTEELGTMRLKEYRVPKGPALNLVQRLRDEAHRFARRYHHHLLSRELLSNERNS